jgi:hypothetical protein
VTDGDKAEKLRQSLPPGEYSHAWAAHGMQGWARLSFQRSKALGKPYWRQPQRQRSSTHRG